MSRLRMSFLGSPEIHAGEQRVIFPTRKSTALLAYLSLTGKSCPRDVLATFLWPDLDQTRAHASLRNALWSIGNAGQKECLEIHPDSIGLRAGYALDVDAFHEKMAQVRAHGHKAGDPCRECAAWLAEAAAIYRGDFLAGFTLRDSAGFDDWQLFQSESLRQELASVLEQLVNLHSVEGDWEQALPHARRWVDLDAFNEAAHRGLLRIYAQAGKRSLFLKQYEVLRLSLEQELGIEPEAETRQLYEDFLAGRFPAAIRKPAAAMPPAKDFLQLNLPAPLTSLLGRDQEVSALCDYLLSPDTHLLTLTGPPGIGKTRLSIQVASELVEHFKDGAIFIPLAPIHDSSLVALTITQSLAIIESGDWTPAAALKKSLRHKSMLLVLDNFEHVLDAAPLVGELLQSCPQLKILATSRAPLKIRGERQYALAPLPLPDMERLPAVDVLSRIPSVALFIAIAGLIDPDFALTESNASLVAEICHQLDGLPLAIELAAAWIKLLPPQELYRRLNHRLALLKGGPVDLPPRQRTLRAAIDWSYELLSPWEQTLLQRLTIFVGGWTLEAAGAVTEWGEAGAASSSSGDVLEGLSSLVDKSLVDRKEYPNGSIRFSMLDTIREYASEKLASTGEIDILLQRYAAYYLELVATAEQGLRGSQQQHWLFTLRNEHNNVRAALLWALDVREAETALKMAGSLWRYWWMHGHLSEGRDWLEKALALSPTGQTALRAKALNGVGILARSQGDYAHARVYLEECLAIQRSLQDRNGIAAVLNSLGVLFQYQMDYEKAFLHHEESLKYRREIGRLGDIAVSINNLAMVAHEQGEFARSDELYLEALKLMREVNDARGIAAALANRGALMNDRGDTQEAEALFRESMSILEDLGQREDIIECLEGFAGVAILLGQPRRAARLFGAAEALREVIGSQVPLYKHARLRIFSEKLADQLDPAALKTELSAGKGMSLDEAIAYALGEVDPHANGMPRS
jgi:predicted ATPase/DNA-binding SARP family transcriptional activator